MHKLLGNRFINALGLLMLFSAAFHMVLVVIYAIKEKDINHLNFFNILEIDRYVPGIIEGQYSIVVATGCMLAIYIVFYLLLKKK